MPKLNHNRPVLKDIDATAGERRFSNASINGTRLERFTPGENRSDSTSISFGLCIRRAAREEDARASKGPTTHYSLCERDGSSLRQ